jgi:hypothetical protein
VLDRSQFANSLPAKVPHDHLPLAELHYRAHKAASARRPHLPRRPTPTPAAPFAVPRAAARARRLNFPLCRAARSLPGRKFGYPRALSNLALSVSPSRGFPHSLFSLSRKRRHPSLTASLPIMRLRRSTSSACSCALDRSVRWRTVVWALPRRTLSEGKVFARVDIQAGSANSALVCHRAHLAATGHPRARP